MALPGESWGWTSNQWQDWARNNRSGYYNWLQQQGQSPTLTTFLKDFGARGVSAGLPYMGAGMDIGLANLMEILASKGKTDPGLMNRQLRGIQRDTQAQQMDIQGELARRGLGASGMGQALSSSAGAAGAERKAQVRDVEVQRQEERKRQDLQLLLQLIMQPSFDASALQLGQYNANRQYNMGKQGAAMGAVGDIAQMAMLAAILSCWVAEEIFHNDSDEDAVRVYMTTNVELLNAYMESGKDLAYLVKHNSSMRELVEPRFHEMADIGYHLIG